MHSGKEKQNHQECNSTFHRTRSAPNTVIKRDAVQYAVVTAVNTMGGSLRHTPMKQIWNATLIMSADILKGASNLASTCKHRRSIRSTFGKTAPQNVQCLQQPVVKSTVTLKCNMHVIEQY